MRAIFLGAHLPQFRLHHSFFEDEVGKLAVFRAADDIVPLWSDFVEDIGEEGLRKLEIIFYVRNTFLRNYICDELDLDLRTIEVRSGTPLIKPGDVIFNAVLVRALPRKKPRSMQREMALAIQSWYYLRLPEGD